MTNPPIHHRYAVSEDKPDVPHALVRAGVAAVPVIGGSINELLAVVLSPAIDRRKRQWMDVVAHGLAKLEERVEGFSLTSLAERPDFLSAFMHAFHAALKTHEAEKLDALRNSVLNVAMDQIYSESKTEHFLLLVDQYSIWHLRVLKYLDNPAMMLQAWGRPYPDKGCTIVHSLAHALPRLSEEFILRILSNIFLDGLIEADHQITNRRNLDFFSSVGYKSISGLLQKRTTEVGDEFLSFIEAPAIVKEDA